MKKYLAIGAALLVAILTVFACTTSREGTDEHVGAIAPGAVVCLTCEAGQIPQKTDGGVYVGIEEEAGPQGPQGPAGPAPSGTGPVLVDGGFAYQGPINLAGGPSWLTGALPLGDLSPGGGSVGQLLTLTDAGWAARDGGAGGSAAIDFVFRPGATTLPSNTYNDFDVLTAAVNAYGGWAIIDVDLSATNSSTFVMTTGTRVFTNAGIVWKGITPFYALSTGAVGLVPTIQFPSGSSITLPNPNLILKDVRFQANGNTVPFVLPTTANPEIVIDGTTNGNAGIVTGASATVPTVTYAGTLSGSMVVTGGARTAASASNVPAIQILGAGTLNITISGWITTPIGANSIQVPAKSQIAFSVFTVGPLPSGLQIIDGGLNQATNNPTIFPVFVSRGFQTLVNGQGSIGTAPLSTNGAVIVTRQRAIGDVSTTTMYDVIGFDAGTPGFFTIRAATQDGGTNTNDDSIVMFMAGQ